MESINKFVEFTQLVRPGIDSALEAFLPPETGPSATLRAAMRYSVLDGGKRLRPALCLAAARAFGAGVECAMPAACALEIVHAFTLIHDDLPCMDDDDLRRGKPTSHKVYGEALAVLAGDALHNLAYRILAKHCVDRLPREAGSIVIEEFSLAVAQVCEGQAVDIESEGAAPDAETLKFIHDNKTGALLRAAVVCGAACAGATGLYLKKLEEFSAAAGAMFQNVDDILDEAGDSSVTGKAGPSDGKKAKLTTVSAIGLKEAVSLAREQKSRATSALSGIAGAEILAAFPEYVYERIPESLR